MQPTSFTREAVVDWAVKQSGYTGSLRQLAQRLAPHVWDWAVHEPALVPVRGLVSAGCDELVNRCVKDVRRDTHTVGGFFTSIFLWWLLPQVLRYIAQIILTYLLQELQKADKQQAWMRIVYAKFAN
jgi:hypothetical protein